MYRAASLAAGTFPRTLLRAFLRGFLPAFLEAVPPARRSDSQRAYSLAMSVMNALVWSTFRAWARRCSYMTLYRCTSLAFSR